MDFENSFLFLNLSHFQLFLHHKKVFKLNILEIFVMSAEIHILMKYSTREFDINFEDFAEFS